MKKPQETVEWMHYTITHDRQNNVFCGFGLWFFGLLPC